MSHSSEQDVSQLVVQNTVGRAYTQQRVSFWAGEHYSLFDAALDVNKVSGSTTLHRVNKGSLGMGTAIHHLSGRQPSQYLWKSWTTSVAAMELGQV